MLETVLQIKTSGDYFIFIREYNKTRKKDLWGLRCGDPLLVDEYQLEVFPLLNVNKNDFKAVTKVKVWIQIF